MTSRVVYRNALWVLEGVSLAENIARIPKMADFIVENLIEHVQGAKLKRQHTSEKKVEDLRRWLICRGFSSKQIRIQKKFGFLFEEEVHNGTQQLTFGMFSLNLNAPAIFCRQADPLQHP